MVLIQISLILYDTLKNKEYHKKSDSLFDDRHTDTDKDPVGLFWIPIT